MAHAQAKYSTGRRSRYCNQLISNTDVPLHGKNLSIAAFLKQPLQWRQSVLGALCFSTSAVEHLLPAGGDVPCLRVPMQRLDGDDSICEVWQGHGGLTQGRSGAIHYRYDQDVLFGVIELDESGFNADANKTPLQQATESAYDQVFTLLDALQFPYLFRFWNYIADINTHSFELERYRQFNLGRQDAFLSHGREVTGNVPAACALGFPSPRLSQGPLTIAFLAGRVMPVSIENPRQISAYQYPQQYGPRSPTFSRASLVQLGPDEVLFISGTASIVGHATLHPDDVIAQTRETMANIQAVLGEANTRTNTNQFNLTELHYKVYLRHAPDLDQVRAELKRIVGQPLHAIYLQADVCRPDLLLEIEATAGHSLPPGPHT